MTVRADVETLRAMIGAKSTTDEALLSWSLEAAGEYIYDRVRPADVKCADVVEAVLLLASRLYKRRQSPEGVSGWDDMGPVRVMARDPDIDRLIEQHVDAYKVWGIA